MFIVYIRKKPNANFCNLHSDICQHWNWSTKVSVYKTAGTPRSNQDASMAIVMHTHTHTKKLYTLLQCTQDGTKQAITKHAMKFLPQVTTADRLLQGQLVSQRYVHPLSSYSRTKCSKRTKRLHWLISFAIPKTSYTIARRANLHHNMKKSWLYQCYICAYR